MKTTLESIAIEKLEKYLLSIIDRTDMKNHDRMVHERCY